MSLRLEGAQKATPYSVFLNAAQVRAVATQPLVDYATQRRAEQQRMLLSLCPTALGQPIVEIVQAAMQAGAIKPARISITSPWILEEDDAATLLVRWGLRSFNHPNDVVPIENPTFLNHLFSSYPMMGPARPARVLEGHQIQTTLLPGSSPGLFRGLVRAGQYQIGLPASQTCDWRLSDRQMLQLVHPENTFFRESE